MTNGEIEAPARFYGGGIDERVKNMKPYVVEMKLPNGSWCPVPGYGFATLDEAAEAWRSIPDDDRERHRVSMIVYRYEPVPEGLL